MLIRSKFDGYSADGARRYFKGGGGGGPSYAGLETLYQEQTESARLLREQAEANLPGAVQSYVDETKQVLDPGYVDKQADMAEADVLSANAKERAATERSLSSMGVNPNDARFAGSARSAELNNAARLAAGKNATRTSANNYQLNVAKDAVGTFTGQSNQAATQMGNAASGLGSVYSSQANQHANQSAQQANAIGSLVGAGIAGYGIYNQQKDGGRIVAPRGLKRIERHMMGGGVGSQQNKGFFQMQAIAPPPSAQRQPAGSPVGAALGTANTINSAYKASQGIKGGAPQQAGAQAAGPTASEAAATSPYQGASTTTGAQTAATSSGESAAAATSPYQGAAVSEAGSQAAGQAAGDAAASAAGEVAAEQATAAAADAAVATGAETAATSAAGSTAASAGLGAAMGAVSTALPWIGAAYAVGSLMDWWNKGGEVGTQNKGVSEEEAMRRFATAEQNGAIQDIRSGGKVPGEWQGNTDNVPALLTEDEHVVNAEAAAMIGHDKLEALNKKGLALRANGYTPGRIRSGLGLKKESA
jgi:hypothetical protein